MYKRVLVAGGCGGIGRAVVEAELKRRAAGYPLGRLPTMEEPAYAVAWLASEEASMVTAQTISPNGGIAVVGY